MAFQQQGGINGGAAGGPDHHPQGTEYTLQGSLVLSSMLEGERCEMRDACGTIARDGCCM